MTSVLVGLFRGHPLLPLLSSTPTSILFLKNTMPARETVFPLSFASALLLSLIQTYHMRQWITESTLFPLVYRSSAFRLISHCFNNIFRTATRSQARPAPVHASNRDLQGSGDPPENFHWRPPLRLGKNLFSGRSTFEDPDVEQRVSFNAPAPVLPRRFTNFLTPGTSKQY